MKRGQWVVIGWVNPGDDYSILFSGLSYRAACCITIGIRQAGAVAGVYAA